MGWMTVKCPSCGENVQLDTDRAVTFCMNCGARLEKETLYPVYDARQSSVAWSLSAQGQRDVQKLRRRDAKYTKAKKHVLLAYVIPAAVCFCLSLMMVYVNNNAPIALLVKILSVLYFAVLMDVAPALIATLLLRKNFQIIKNYKQGKDL